MPGVAPEAIARVHLGWVHLSWCCGVIMVVSCFLVCCVSVVWCFCVWFGWCVFGLFWVCVAEVIVWVRVCVGWACLRFLGMRF